MRLMTEKCPQSIVCTLVSREIAFHLVQSEVSAQVEWATRHLKHNRTMRLA